MSILSTIIGKIKGAAQSMRDMMQASGRGMRQRKAKREKRTDKHPLHAYHFGNFRPLK